MKQGFELTDTGFELMKLVFDLMKSARCIPNFRRWVETLTGKLKISNAEKEEHKVYAEL